MNRKYNLTLSQLIDLLSIVTLKSIKLGSKNEFKKKSYELEAKEIIHDIDLIMKTKKTQVKHWGKLIRAIQLNMFVNELIWQNETKNREGNNTDTKALQLTHSVNGMRRRAGNEISKQLGERVDLNLDTVLDEVCEKFGYNFKEII